MVLGLLERFMDGEGAISLNRANGQGADHSLLTEIDSNLSITREQQEAMWQRLRMSLIEGEVEGCQSSPRTRVAGHEMVVSQASRSFRAGGYSRQCACTRLGSTPASS